MFASGKPAFLLDLPGRRGMIGGRRRSPDAPVVHWTRAPASPKERLSATYSHEKGLFMKSLRFFGIGLLTALALAAGCDKGSSRGKGDGKETRTDKGDTNPGAARAKPPEGWQEFRFPEAGFKVHFPAKPGIVIADGPAK